MDGTMGGGNPMGDFAPQIKRQRMSPPLSERVMLYVRQDNEDVYTPLHVVPPTTVGLLNAVSAGEWPLSAPHLLPQNQTPLPCLRNAYSTWFDSMCLIPARLPFVRHFLWEVFLSPRGPRTEWPTEGQNTRRKTKGILWDTHVHGHTYTRARDTRTPRCQYYNHPSSVCLSINPCIK